MHRTRHSSGYINVKARWIIRELGSAYSSSCGILRPVWIPCLVNFPKENDHCFLLQADVCLNSGSELDRGNISTSNVKRQPRVDYAPLVLEPASSHQKRLHADWEGRLSTCDSEGATEKTRRIIQPGFGAPVSVAGMLKRLHIICNHNASFRNSNS